MAVVSVEYVALDWDAHGDLYQLTIYSRDGSRFEFDCAAPKWHDHADAIHAAMSKRRVAHSGNSPVPIGGKRGRRRDDH